MHVPEREVTAIAPGVPLEGEGHKADDPQFYFAGHRDRGEGGGCWLKLYLAIAMTVSVDLAAEVGVIEADYDDVAVHGLEFPVKGDDTAVEHPSLDHGVTDQRGVVGVQGVDDEVAVKVDPFLS